MTENEIGKTVVDSAVAVHRELGPGLLETVYEVILAHELRHRGLWVERQVPISIEYRGVKFDEAFRADIVIESKVVIELKSIEQVNPAHKKQLQTYLRLAGYKLGFLLNFGEALMKKGITRAVNGLQEDEPLRLGVLAREKKILG
jgi:GxxExxY protein